MANVKKLTRSMIAALQAAKNETCYWRGDGRTYRRSTIESIVRRGLIEYHTKGNYRLTPAGRQALFEATGENDPTVMEQFDDADSCSSKDSEK